MSNLDNNSENTKNFKFETKSVNFPFGKNRLDEENVDSAKPKQKLYNTMKKFSESSDNFFEVQKKKFNQHSLVVFDKETREKHGNDHLNSFSSIFRRDHEEIKGIQRVFRKSFGFLVLSVLSFTSLVFSSISLFQTNPILLAISIVMFIVFTNIFYIIVADKSYIWLNLAIQFVILILFHTTLKLSFAPITVVCILFILLLSYLSYTELEKIQLGSRLFSIGQITRESTSVLLTMLSIVLSIGLYNSVIHHGIQKIFTDNVLNNNTVFNQYVMGDKKSNLTLNNALGLTIKNQQTISFGQFLEDHFRNSKAVLPDNEKPSLREKCAVELGRDACQDLALFSKITTSRLEEWRAIAYPNIDYPLETQLDDEKYRAVVKQYYINQVCILEKGDECGFNKEIPSLKTDSEVATTTKAKISDVLTKDISVSNLIF
jgi:hypothetical protein